jgi:hypothetical protein
MDHWGVLELDRDADERSIKRQYAKLLKVNRPDDDPEAFQRLREAYEYALNWARMRFDEEEYEGDALGEATAESAHSPLTSEVLNAQPPQLDDAGPTSSELAFKLAADLAAHTTDENLEQQYRHALEQDCAAPFQQALLNRCLQDPEANIGVLKAAVAHLHWLTPWQTARISQDQEVHLTEALLDNTQTGFESRLSQGDERGLFNDIETLSRQPWLNALERRQQLYRWMLIFLHNTQGWSPALFDRICTLFGWETNSSLPPQPEFVWYRLIERCEKHAYLQHLQRSLIRNSTITDEQAAVLVLDPPRSNAERVHLARNGNVDLWDACERLCSQLTHRYPDLLEHFPNADLEGWRTLHTKPIQARRWIWIGWMLMTLLYTLPQHVMSGPTTFADVAALLGVYPVLMTAGCMLFMRIWGPLADALQAGDEWVSQKLIPDSLSWPGSQALLIRHGVPLVLCGVIMARVGPWAFGCYSILMVLWLIASPGRHPQAYGALSERLGRLTGKIKRGPLIFVAVVMVFMAYKALTYPAFQTVPVPEKPTATAAPFDCSSQEALNLMNKSCQHAMTTKTCEGKTVEQKIALCRSMQAKGQLPAGEQRPAGSH